MGSLPTASRRRCKSHNTVGQWSRAELTAVSELRLALPGERGRGDESLSELCRVGFVASPTTPQFRLTDN